ncbi:MAG: acetylxylan esterase [Cytophagales bacterium]|uniref:alpha/beta hydrolase family protein n=1 Tax=Cyclobacterium marinum TaxID=104 RepID=UPI0030DB5A54|nr:acetylxylan esterase [Cytophagales bacterium]|tara:strand:- start:8541 stop:9797 length:1257 start_codon:yes stop_codon:yes gene_type:complete
MKTIFTLIYFVGISIQVLAQDFEPNYEEDKVPEYQLPDLLRMENGQLITNKRQWSNRRAELVEIFENEIYGKSPVWDGQISSKVLLENKDYLNGEATRKVVKLTLKRGEKSLDFNLLVFYPNSGKQVPAFLGLNFYGNHTISSDEQVAVPDAWIRNNEKIGSFNNKASEKGRGQRIANWPYEEILTRGYGLVTMYYGEIDPDYEDGFKDGVHALYSERKREPNSWASIAGWAWGLSRVMDFLEGEDWIDNKKVAVLGHSRLGKAALWAGATDERFAMVISNNSGCGGAALSRRAYGETVGRMIEVIPYWFSDSFKVYYKMENDLPVDQHQLLALMAPRPLYVASGAEDKWADPKGEFLSCVAASPAYKLFGKVGMPATVLPPLDQPVMGTIGYHIRSGGHGLLPYDWQQYLDFADRHF